MEIIYMSKYAKLLKQNIRYMLHLQGTNPLIAYSLVWIWFLITSISDDIIQKRTVGIKQVTIIFSDSSLTLSSNVYKPSCPYDQDQINDFLNELKYCCLNT